MSAPVAPAPAAPVAPAAPAPIAAPAPAAVVPSTPATEAPPTLESMVASLTVEQAETWVPPGEEATPSEPEAPKTPEQLTGEQPAKTDPAPTFELEMPTPPRMNAEGKKESGVLKTKFATQAEADTAKFHVKRSAQLDTVTAELAERQADKTTLDFFDQKPVEAFAFLAAAKPTSAQAFVSDYLAANPQLAVELLGTIGYTVTAAKDPEAMQLKAELARIKLAERTNQARLSHEQTAAQQEWNHAAGRTIREVATAAGLDLGSTDFKLFAQIASQTISEKFPNGTGRDELALALQPLVQRAMLMLGNATPAAQAPAAQPSTTAPPSPETFAARDRQMAPFAKLQGGQALASVLAPDAQPKATETLEQMISRLERG